MSAVCLSRLRLLCARFPSYEMLTSPPELHVEDELPGHPGKPVIESYSCDLRENHSGVSTECIRLAAAVPWPIYSLLIVAARHPDIRCLET